MRAIAVAEGRAAIDLSRCIRCYCCHEICTGASLEGSSPPARVKSSAERLMSNPGEEQVTMPCPFCNPAPEDIVAENDLAYARYDIHPVSPGHLLIIPFRHVADYFETTYEERVAFARLIDDCREISERERHPDGYNIGVNVGEAAGQNIMHVHIHFIPRYRGNTAGEHEGGVRRSVPGRV